MKQERLHREMSEDKTYIFHVAHGKIVSHTYARIRNSLPLTVISVSVSRLFSLLFRSISLSIPSRFRHLSVSHAKQLASNFVLFLSANILGMMSFFFYERQQRRAFLETCQSLEAKLVLEEESQKQVC